MCDSEKTEKELVEQLQKLRSRVTELENIEAEYKRQEETLLQSRQRCAKAGQIGHFGYWERNLLEDKAVWSKGSYRILGVHPDQFEPRYENFLSLVHPGDRDLFKSTLEKAVSRGKPFDIEFRIVRPDGTERVLHSVAEVHYDESGRPLKLVGTAHDITERKRAEDALRKARDELETRVEERTAALSRTNALLKKQIAERQRVEEMLSLKNAAIESSINAIAFVDIEGNLTYVNNSFLKMWGYSEQKQVLGKPSVQFWADVDQAATVRDTVHNQGHWIGELVAKRKNGSTFDVQLSVSSVNDEEGNLLCLMGSFVDITERKRVERELKQYRFMVESAHDVIFFKDLESRYIIANKKSLEAFGLSREQVIGKNDDEIMLNKEQARKNIEDDRSVFKTGTIAEFTKQMTDRDGKERWFQAIKVPQFDDKGNIVGLIGVARDITERKQTEEALRESKEKYRLLIESLNEGIWVIDKDACTTFVNPCMAEMLGYTIEEMQGKHLFSFMDGNWVKVAEQKLKSRKKGIEEQHDFEFVRKDGSRVYTTLGTTTMTDERGNYIGAIAVVMDITKRKRAEETLQKARDELEIRVEQRTAELAKTNVELRSEINERKKAEEKLLIYQEQLRSLASELSLAEERMRRQIATDIHDNIGQNLGISKIKLESLRQSVSSPEVAESLNEIGELIGQTIESSRSLTFELSPPVLYELGFEPAVEWLVRNTRRRHGISADFKTDGRAKPLDHNVRVLLFQAVRELLVNVVKHAKATSVTVATRRVGDKIQVSVADDGVGFDISELSSKGYRTGGFGLFSIRERLGHIGGRLDVESKPGRGTKVTLVAQINHQNKKTKGKRK